MRNSAFFNLYRREKKLRMTPDTVGSTTATPRSARSLLRMTVSGCHRVDLSDGVESVISPGVSPAFVP